LEQGWQSGRTGIEVNAILGVNAVYVPTLGLKPLINKTISLIIAFLAAKGTLIS
jgi:hypothetical protein